ncbi:hypothetical protein A2W24_00225 [Microgenomates group bacterium RBG_16_45_19]|nr:MAG: hypothetical protein A2W24_00225 [Microgenomates group bacterium RBG_16_45_19]
MSENLLKQADQLKSEADELLLKVNLEKHFSDLGQVHVVSSYALDLMFRPDIDIFITLKSCDLDKAIIKTKELLDTKLFQTIGFANHLDFPFPSNWRGCYWELKVIKPNIIWKFDVWYTAESSIKAIQAIPIIQSKLQADPSTRLKILTRKQTLFDGVKYRNNLNGFKICEEILGKIL